MRRSARAITEDNYSPGDQLFREKNKQRNAIELAEAAFLLKNAVGLQLSAIRYSMEAYGIDFSFHWRVG